MQDGMQQDDEIGAWQKMRKKKKKKEKNNNNNNNCVIPHLILS